MAAWILGESREMGVPESGFPHLLESPGFFSLKFDHLESPGQSLCSWKLKLEVLESFRKMLLKVMHLSSGSNGKQAAIV